MPPDYATLTEAYRNTAEHNDRLHREFTGFTWADPVLGPHRRHVLDQNLGFGDDAFHALWAVLLAEAVVRFGEVRLLEIGVFKGQVISLWSLLAREYRWRVQISALSPLTGQPLPSSRLVRWLRYRLDGRFRERAENGDFYEAGDYEPATRAHFAHPGLDFSTVRLFRGYSTDPALLARLSGETFHLVYVDGDHTFAGARHDFTTFGPKVVPGGWLVADDASCELPGTAFWKGHPAVSAAVHVLPGLGFTNVLNIGHNRVYERTRTGYEDPADV
ncbi:MAG TPA: class I SAM-dependent methyltransferase [Lacunisphaera sp.]